MPLETSPEAPVPVRRVAGLLKDWIDRLGAIWVEGQVTGYNDRRGARMHFFTLRDTEVAMSLSISVDAGVLGRMDEPLADGQRVVVHARPDFYEGRGSLSLRAREIRPVGLGALLEELARLKALLTAEGLFAAERKQPLPFLPRGIGLICGRNAAARDDVLVNVEDRWPGMPVEVREVAVQGVRAVPEVMAALAELDELATVDVIVIARGGGSPEDLLPFSNEALIRAVAAARTPVVSAIGHEQDTPLLDYVADLRASTPTDAAKRVVPAWTEQRALVDTLLARGRRALNHRLDRESQGLDHLRARLGARVSTWLDGADVDVAHLAARLSALSPAATLARGYAIVTTPDGAVVRTPQETSDGDLLSIRVDGGTFAARTEGSTP
jgi:exodeoxyribonuclease VII large subunit